MGLNLDLRDSWAKLKRASDHLKTLDSQESEFIKNRNPYSIRVGEIDPDTGWCRLFLCCGPLGDERATAVVVGDFINNLRSALDYIVTALVDASGITLTVKHQFPIFADPAKYAEKIWRRGERVGRGSLKGIRHGLVEIEGIQPYHPSGDAQMHPLWHLHEFSNSDKHRAVSMHMALPVAGSTAIDTDGNITEVIPRRVDHDWGSQKEHEFARIRFAKPYPTYVHAGVPPQIEVMFGVTLLTQQPRGLAHESAFQADIYNLVSKIVYLFEAL